MNTNDAVLLRVHKDNSASFVTIFITIFSENVRSNYMYYVIRNIKRLTNVEICCNVDINLNSHNVEISLYTTFNIIKLLKLGEHE